MYSLKEVMRFHWAGQDVSYTQEVEEVPYFQEPRGQVSFLYSRFQDNTYLI